MSKWERKGVLSMKDVKQKGSGRLGTLVLGISLMGILYGWFVYAGEIENDISTVSGLVTTANKANPVDSTAVTALEQIGNTSEGQLNTGISNDLYGASTMTPAAAMITKHFGTYCAGGVESGNCTQDPLLQFGDIKLSSILSGTAYDSARAQATQDFLTNYLSPPNVPYVTNFQSNETNGTISAATITADPNLQANYVQALADEALLSVVRESFGEMIAKRTVNSGTNTSWMQSVESQVLQRAMNTAWVNSLAAMTPTQLATEQAKMQAQQMLLAYEGYRQGERLEALLTALVLQNFRSAKAAQSVVSSPSPSASTILNNAQQNGGQSGSTVAPSP